MRRKLAAILLVFALAVTAGDLSSRLALRFDVTPRKIHSLSEKTLKVLEGLGGSPLAAVVFMEEDEYGREEAEALLRRYKSEYRPLVYRFISPAKNPGLVAEYGVGSHGVVVWEWRGGREKSQGISEEAFTNGIHRIVNPRRPVVYFTTGHGEKSRGRELSGLGAKLEGENRDLRDLLIQKEGGVPADADCLVVAGPKTPFAREEVEIIEKYFRKGGRIILLLDPYGDGGFGDFLRVYGIGLAEDVVVDKGSRVFGGDELFPMSVEYPSHPVSRGIDGVCIFPVARSLALAAAGEKSSEARAIARTSENAWAETDRRSLAAGRPVYDPASDRAGPIILAASAEYLAEYPDRDGALVVFGDSDFAANAYIGAAQNTAIFLNALDWLLGSGETLGIRPSEPGHHPIVLSRSQGIFLGWFVLGFLPAAVALLGIRSWWKRRSAP